jgi:hypothetical protein
MQSTRENVKCRGKVYSNEAWRLIYGYIMNHKSPNVRFETEMKRLGISLSDAYALYYTQLYKPWMISFLKTKKTKGRLHISVKVAQKIPVPKARKR